jgi:hypothetical protein
MFPGKTSKVSEENIALATTIYPKSDLVRVTDTTSTTVVATIAAPFGGFGGVTFLQNASGAAITTVTTGNILTAVSIGDKALVVMVYSQILGKYIVGALA